MIVQGFAGPGGWCTGLRMAGYEGPAVGIELDRDACRTGMAAGHWRIQADVSTFPLAHLAGKVTGLIQSPPCPSFSMAGDGAGKADMPNVYRLIADFAAGRPPAQCEWVDERSRLTAEPMRWATALRPRWIALEQVPPVLPMWQYMAELLRVQGYRTWTGVLSAEEYGVPQTRKRAFLVASMDGSISFPMPTHQPYRAGRAALVEPDLFGRPLPPPVSMTEALGGGDIITYERDTSTSGSTLAQSVNHWQVRPATTVQGDARIWPPGHKVNAGDRARHADADARYGDRAGTDAVRVTVAEAGVLQSFSANYPWRGTKTAQHRQVGDAVPPLLAAAVLRPLLAASVAARTTAV